MTFLFRSRDAFFYDRFKDTMKSFLFLLPIIPVIEIAAVPGTMQTYDKRDAVPTVLYEYVRI